MSEEYKFSLQFIVDNQQMFNMCVNEVKIFEKTEYTDELEMLVKPVRRNREDQRNHILNSMNGEIINKMRIFLFSIEDDIHVKQYVKKAAQLIIKEIAFINKIKMERLLTIIKMGISPLCKNETMESLTDLEYLISIFYMADYKLFTDEQRYDFRKRMCQIDAAENEYMNNYIDKIDLEMSLSEKFIELVNQTDVESPKQCIMMFMKYMKAPTVSDNFIRSIDSIRDVIDCLNSKLNQFLKFDKRIIFSNICISTILKGNELYVDFYGYINEWICGSFSLDFNRLKNRINNNYPYYIFYLVTCCYCHLYRTNVLRVKIDVPINNMFMFFDKSYYSRIKPKIDHFERGFHHEGIFKHLQKFFELEGFHDV